MDRLIINVDKSDEIVAAMVAARLIQCGYDFSYDSGNTRFTASLEGAGDKSERLMREWLNRLPVGVK